MKKENDGKLVLMILGFSRWVCVYVWAGTARDSGGMPDGLGPTAQITRSWSKKKKVAAAFDNGKGLPIQRGTCV